MMRTEKDRAEREVVSLVRMTEGALVAWLRRNDPNGVYEPEAVMREFGVVNTREELLAMALEQAADGWVGEAREAFDRLAAPFMDGGDQ